MPRTSPARFLPLGLSLRTKSFLFVGFVVFTLAGVLFASLSTILLDSMNRMQNELTKELLDSVISQLNQIARQQSHKVIDHAVRDETFDFLKGKVKGYLDTHFDPRADTSEQDLVLLFDRQKNPFAWMFVSGGTRTDTALPEYLRADEARHSGLLQEGKAGSAIIGTPDGLLILSAHPVTRSDGSGPSPGWLVYGRHVGPRWFEEIKELTGVSLSPFVNRERDSFKRRETKTLTTDALGVCRIFLSQEERPEGESHGVSTIVEFEHPSDQPPAALHLKLPSVVYSAAVDLRNKMAWSSLIGGIVFATFCFLAIDHLFIKKITRMDREFQLLANSTDTQGRLAEGSHDEFARLARSANRLLDSLRRRRTESENQEKLLSSVLDSSSEGIMAYRSLRNEKGAISDFILVLANKSAETMVNRRSEDMLGKCMLGLFPGNMTEGLFDRYVRVVDTGIGETFESFYGHEEIRNWFRISAEPWADGFVVTFEEISQRKRVEQELKVSIQELERFNRAMIGREDRILEMKSEVNQLRTRLGLPKEYRVDSLSDES